VLVRLPRFAATADQRWRSSARSSYSSHITMTPCQLKSVAGEGNLSRMMIAPRSGVILDPRASPGPNPVPGHLVLSPGEGLERGVAAVLLV
jgi:hypothetical protein